MRGTWLFGLWVLACTSSDQGAGTSSAPGTGGGSPSDGSVSTGAGGAGASPPGTGGTGLVPSAGGKPSSGGNRTDAGVTASGGARSVEGGPRRLDIYVMIDQSTSMSCATSSGAMRWDAVTGGFTSFVQSADPGIAVGIGYFGVGSVPFLSSCVASDYTPDVEIGPLPANAKAIVDSLAAHGPSTNTPTLPALQSAVAHAAAWKAQHTDDVVVVVLVTDGQPNACGASTVAEVAQVADSGFKTNGIPTYVLGVMDTSLDCGTLDPNPPNVADLNTVAVSGGTRRALVVDGALTQALSAQFLTAMNAIVGDARP